MATNEREGAFGIAYEAIAEMKTEVAAILKRLEVKEATILASCDGQSEQCRAVSGGIRARRLFW